MGNPIKGLIQSTYRKLNRRLAVRKNVTYAPDFRIGAGGLVMAPDQLIIGPRVVIGSNAWIACNGSIGEGVLISSYVGIVGKYDHDSKDLGRYISESRWLYDADAPPRDARHAVHIEDDVWIGFGVTILSGVRIGRGAIVAAGAIVVRDVEPYTVVAGNPAHEKARRLSNDEITRHEQMLNDRRGR